MAASPSGITSREQLMDQDTTRFTSAEALGAAGATRGQLDSWRRRGVFRSSYGQLGDGRGGFSLGDAAAVSFLAAVARDFPTVPARVFAPIVRGLKRGRAAELANLALVRERPSAPSGSLAAWGIRDRDDVADLDPARVHQLADLVHGAVERAVAHLGGAAA